MALTRPVLQNIPAFDATNEQTFTFTVQGATSQIVANMLTIRNNDTNDIVYQEKQETFRYSHVVNADELTNGVYYNATVVVYDADDNASPESIPIQFWCYSTPTLEFTNIPVDNIIPNASFDFQFTYDQAQNEPLNSYTLNLFNAAQVQISTSGLQYTNSETVPYNGSYTFTGFENGTIYYIQLSGITVEGTIITTDFQQITANYVEPDIYTRIELTNNCEEGYITIASNIVLIEGKPTPDPPTYIDNKEIDLTDPGANVEWNQGFNINGDFLARIWFRNPVYYSTFPALDSQSIIAQFSNTQGQQFVLKYKVGFENLESQAEQAYMELYVTSVEGMDYYIYSNYVEIVTETTQENQYLVNLTRVNNIYQLQLETITSTS